MIYSSFTDWVNKFVIPLQTSQPHWHRLDGKESGGNRQVMGRFQYNGQVCKVHADTHFEPIMRAYEAVISGKFRDPFVVEATKTGSSLNFVSALRRHPKHFYVYLEA